MSTSRGLLDDCIEQIRSWNQSPLEPVWRCIHELVTEQANHAPNELAVDSWDGKLTYGELDGLSDQLASNLRQKGVRNETKVPICFEKSKWAVIAILAVLKAGGAFVPLDPAYPLDRLRLLVAATKAPILLASTSNTSLLAHDVADIVEVGEQTSADWPMADLVGMDTVPNNTAYVLYTSGSTGTPKGYAFYPF